MKKIIFALFILSAFIARPCFAAGPVISPAPATASFVTGAYITWQTDMASDSRVDYGPSNAYGSYLTDPSSVTHHVMVLTDLNPGATYHFKVTSGGTTSADFTFTTYASPTGTVKTVKASGGDYQTVSACASAASPGWTCLVYAGSYAGATPNSGSSAGGYVTILAQEAASLSGFNTSGRSYIAIKGMEITGSGAGNNGASHHVVIENNYIHDTAGACINPQDSAASDWWVIRHNILYACGYVGQFITGSNVLIENNDTSNQVNDCGYGGLTNSVIRNNTCHDYNPQGSGQHLDGWQWDGSSAVAFSQSLFEGNIIQRCDDSTHNCHVLILRNPGGNPASENTIVRYNYAQAGDAGIVMGGGSTDNVSNDRTYNNTLALEFRSGPSCGDANGQFITRYRGPYGKSLNNISYNSCYTSCSPWGTDTGVVNNYDLAYDSADPSAGWGPEYAAEATFNSLKNKNPSFSNYPYDGSLSSNSPAIDAGSHLTTVTGGCGTSSLALADARWFQPGWAGTHGDTLAIGSTVAGAAIARISAINYSANTVTLASSVTCATGDKVWLYQKSDGARVLYGSAPDIGAYEYSGHPLTLESPKNLRIINP